MKKNEHIIVERLQEVADLQASVGKCFLRLSELIKNGRVQKQFKDLALEAKEVQNQLCEKIQDIAGETYRAEILCKRCRLREENLSILGAINLGLEATKTMIKCYKTLIKESRSLQEQRFFKELKKRVSQQRKILEREKDIQTKKGLRIGCIDGYCIPQIISNLWEE